jgi:hypothetical protein
MNEDFRGFAYYDVSTDTIHGAKEGTLTYYHEQGHQAWAKRGIEQEFQLWQFVVLLAMVPALTFLISDDIILLFVSAIPLILYLISETHAWIFAINKWRKIKNGTF